MTCADPLLDHKLQGAFWKGLGLRRGTDVSCLALGEHPRWDSLGHMDLVAAIEDAFGLQLGPEAVMALTNYEAARAILAALWPHAKALTPSSQVPT